jgi:predicted AAA+ superfamily ATPase
MSAPSSGYPRRAKHELLDALAESRVTFIEGPRQAGKTTLARDVASELGARYSTLDDQLDRETALDDPEGFVQHEGLLVIDEVQRGGDDLLLAIKAAVDRDPRPGSFLLTGSTRFLTVPNISESLAGRVDLVSLWPLSQGELSGVREQFVDRLFAGAKALLAAEPNPLSRAALFERVVAGGFPEALSRTSRGRARWFESYVRTVVERDVAELVRVHRPDDLARLARFLASRTACEINITSVANELDLPRTTLTGYLPLLRAVFFSFRLPAWSRNVTSKAIKQSKLHLTDSGVAAHLLGASADALGVAGAAHAGALLETFVVSEVMRQLGWSETRVTPHHFRDRDGIEVDLVLEAADGRVAAVEVKAAGSVGSRDLRGLRLLRDRLGDRFAGGVVLCACDEARPAGDRLCVAPVSALWAQ